MTKTNENRRKGHYWTRENSRQNAKTNQSTFWTYSFLYSGLALEQYIRCVLLLCTSWILDISNSIFRVKCSRRCLSFSELGIQRLQKIQVVLLLQQQVINPDIVGQVPCVGAFSVDCPSLHFTAKVCARTRKKDLRKKKLLSIFYTYIWGSFNAPNFWIFKFLK